MQILSTQQEEILQQERRILNELQIALAQFPAAPDDLKALTDSIAQLDDFFLLVVVGEYNAGKSAFINALLGDHLLDEGVTPTTSKINILRYAQETQTKLENENQVSLSLPAELLMEVSIVDTPGTNAIIRSHEAITNDFIPRSDLVLFVTSADRPFTESERVFLERIRDWGKKIVFVVNKIDILNSDHEITQVVEFVSQNGRELLGSVPEIFPVSSRWAIAAKKGQPEVWSKSRFESLENYIRSSLEEENRIRFKLSNPLGVGIFLTDRYLSVVNNRLETLKSDTQMLEDIDAQLLIYKEDMFRDFNFRMADIENLLLSMETRGSEYFDETFRLARFMDLLNKERIRREFEETVINNVPEKIEEKVNELIDWLVSADLRQWQAINEHLSARRREYHDRMIGDLGPGSFGYDRERLMEAVGREAQRVVETYDKDSEAQKIADSAREAVAASAVLEVGAIGLGALVTIIASTVAADVTGILLATFIAALGFIVIPARRRAAKKEMSDKIRDLQHRLAGALRDQFQKEMDRSINKIEDAISPYTRFIRAEQKKLVQNEESLKGLHLKLSQLKAQLFPSP